MKMATIGLVALVAAANCAAAEMAVTGKHIRVEFDSQMHSRVVATFTGKAVPLGPFSASESIQIAGKNVTDFAPGSSKQEAVHDGLGKGVRFVLTGSAAGLRKTIKATAYEDFPDMAVFEVEYTNTAKQDLHVEGWTNHHLQLTATPAGFWSYQSGSYERRPDWILPVKTGFKQENFLGMNDTDYGGGTPISDVWRPDVGIAVGHLELVPKLVSLPVEMPDATQASLGVTYKAAQVLKPGASLRTFRTFVAVHHGDYFHTLAEYRRAMVKQGITIQPAPESAFGPIWCAWGFGRKFTPEQVYNALPVVKRMGFAWVALDDGWQTNEGDWGLVKTKFPNGDPDMRAMVDRFHSDGFRAQLWWSPLAAKPASELARQHPEMLLLNADGSKQKISYWDSWYLCPADPAVVEYHRKLVVKMIRDWGYDGLKLDGQFMNGVPPCYNPAHHHKRPEDSVEALPKFFQAIYDAARSIKPDALVEFCPCGTAYSFFTLPAMNMSVASDPTSSWQVRSKGKTLKALQGDSIAYFGDHVELSDGGVDFASTVGIGGVVGTNFRWPPSDSGDAESRRGNLTPAKEKSFTEWVRIYKEKMLSRGEYLGELYDIGFDRPETHAVRKGDRMYYAFYAPHYNGTLSLRGLGAGGYRVVDYVSGKDLGTVRGPSASLTVQFDGSLLVEATPEDSRESTGLNKN
jgi:alpha-galactosidase